MKIESLIRENIKKLKPYSSARDEFFSQDFTQLDANENPFDNGLNRYPDPYQRDLKKKIAEYKGLEDKNLVLGNGSDELIDLMIRAFCEPKLDNVVGLRPSYGMYKVSCAINDVEYREANLTVDFQLNPEKILEVVDENTKLIFICSPNNPTGNSFELNQIKKLLDQFKGLIIVDEAYIDFSDTDSLTKELSNSPQLVVLQTFSKSFGLAAVRLGMMWTTEKIVEVINKIKPPYNINQLTINEVLGQLKNSESIQNEVNKIKEQKLWLSEQLCQLPGVVKIYPSDANFLLVQVNKAAFWYNRLLENRIVVRDRSNEHNCENCLRISIGTAEENQKLLNVFNQIKNEESIIYR